MRGVVMSPEGGDHTTGDEIGGGAAIIDVETPQLARHVPDVHPVCIAVAIDIQNGNVAGDRVIHARRRQIRLIRRGGHAGGSGGPEHCSVQRVDHVDPVAGAVRGLVRGTLLGAVISATEDQHELL